MTSSSSSTTSPQIGQRVRVPCTDGDDLFGTVTERTTYADGSPGAYVQLHDCGHVIVLPLAELRIDAAA